MRVGGAALFLLPFAGAKTAAPLLLPLAGEGGPTQSGRMRALGLFRTREKGWAAALLFIVFAFLSIGAPAYAEAPTPIATIVPQFAQDSFSATSKAVTALGVSGDPRAVAILEALKAEALFIAPDKTILIKDDAGATTDALTGKPVTPAPTDLKAIRLNNRVRGLIGQAMGTVMLAAPDAARRRAAAETVFASRDAGALPALDIALSKETDAGAKASMEKAKAALVAAQKGAPDADRIAAVKTVAATGGLDALAVLDQTIASSTGAVRDAAEVGKASVQLRLSLWGHAEDVWYGISLGSVLLLASIGLAITFGVMGVINMAHGEMVMLGAYSTFVTQQIIRDHAPALFDYSLLIALPVAFVVTGLVGVLIERSIIRFLYGRPLETLLATYGVSLILQQVVRTIFGANNQQVGAPAFMAGTFQLGGLSITYGRLWIIVFSVAVFFALQAVLRLTPFGLRIRAVTQNRRMASAMGIDTNRIDALAFGLGSAVAGIAGVALSQIDNVSPNLGQGYIIDTFMVVVFGGVGNLWGTLVAAMTLGIGNKFLEPVAGAVLAKIAILVFIILFIQKKPRGLFALKGRAVEA